ncbi:radical SAM protein [Acetivibrio mesophilus]|nr:radical SAM protein [Acetivibrio mesophilus]
MVYDSANLNVTMRPELRRHPCLDAGSHNKYGRIHLPVSPICNIQCKFCRRCFNKWEERPGVTRKILSPKEALTIVDRALELCPQITVVGIAGPGDSLASNHAIDTFRVVHEKYPELIKCLSTNGLMLPDRAKDLVEVGVSTLTVTVNAVDADILSNICTHIVWDGKVNYGKEAALRLLASQTRGIWEAHKRGIFVKINTVLIPGINDEHVGDVARTVAGLGASKINIIPLIPQFEMADIEAPDCAMLNKAREDAEQYLEVFRHCTHCRADACGIPGSNEDLADRLYEQRIETFSHG